MTSGLYLDMARGRSLQSLELSDNERAALERMARRRTVSRQFAERVPIVLECGSRKTNSEVADKLGINAFGAVESMKNIPSVLTHRLHDTS